MYTFTVVPHPFLSDVWRVEGRLATPALLLLTDFEGPHARLRAMDYAAWQNGRKAVAPRELPACDGGHYVDSVFG